MNKYKSDLTKEDYRRIGELTGRYYKAAAQYVLGTLGDKISNWSDFATGMMSGFGDFGGVEDAMDDLEDAFADFGDTMEDVMDDFEDALDDLEDAFDD